METSEVHLRLSFYERETRWSSFVRRVFALVRLQFDRQCSTMAPITDETVEALRDTIHKLESRVHQLETKLSGGDGGSGKAAAGGPSIRMILMGPPGAGKWVNSRSDVL